MGWLELIGTPSVGILHWSDCTCFCCLLCHHYDLMQTDLTKNGSIWEKRNKSEHLHIFNSKLFTDPMLVMQVAEQTDSESFKYNIYSTVVTAFTYVFPILILPLALPIATLRTCISRQCCVPRYKQPIGELIMTSILCLIYLGTLVGVVLPTLAPILSQAGIEVSVILDIFFIAGRTYKFEYLYIS